MSDTAKKPLGRPRSIQSHARILQATLELLAEVGYERTSIDATAARAGVGKTTIYRRYASKEEFSRGRHRKPAGRSTYTRHWHPHRRYGRPYPERGTVRTKSPCPPDHGHDYQRGIQ